MMVYCAKLVDPDYDIYKRTGLSEGMPISNQTAAQRIVADMIQDGFFVDFVEVLIQIDSKGYMGHKYHLRGLDDVVDGVINESYSFDKVSGQFFENQRERISPNWGRLLEGVERRMTVLRLDIADNSTLVKNNPRSNIESAYNDMRNIVDRAVTSRLGRLWSWEGDGALAVFLFGSIEKMAIYAGMEIIHELFFYNLLRNPLDRPINVRIGAHIGQIRYSESEMERQKNETVKQAVIYESLAGKNSLCVSYNLYITMDQITLKLFGGEKTGRNCKYRLYTMGIEK
jgi:class 3 adenylate cyclase